MIPSRLATSEPPREKKWRRAIVVNPRGSALALESLLGTIHIVTGSS